MLWNRAARDLANKDLSDSIVFHMIPGPRTMLYAFRFTRGGI